MILLASGVPDDPYLAANCPKYFPREVRDKFPIRWNSIASGGRSSPPYRQRLINRGGPPCVVRLIDETDADVGHHAMALRGGG